MKSVGCKSAPQADSSGRITNYRPHRVSPVGPHESFLARKARFLPEMTLLSKEPVGHMGSVVLGLDMVLLEHSLMGQVVQVQAEMEPVEEMVP